MYITNRWTGAVLREVPGDTLECADLRGADLYSADLYSANLYSADLRDADLRGADLRGADLRGADLRDADLRDANLRGADLRGADLRDASLRNVNLGGARGITLAMFGLVPTGVDPTLPARIAALVLANPDALDMAQVHTCATTHCLAGWAIHLSGPAGYALQVATSWSVAGAMLMPSAAHLFYASDEEALAWLRDQLTGDTDANAAHGA